MVMPLSKGANERLWDAVIKEALIESMNRELDETEQNIEPHNFSSQFEHNMNKLIKNIGRKEKAQAAGKVIGKFAVTAATVMGIMFGGFLTQQEVYAAVGNVIRSIFSTHDKYTYQDNSEDIVFDDTIRLGYVPDGYELRSVYYMGNANLLTYESEDEKSLYFNYSLAEDSSITVDNESHSYKEIIEYNEMFYFYKSEQDDFNTIIWFDGKYAYSIDAQISEDEIVKIAENIKSAK